MGVERSSSNSTLFGTRLDHASVRTFLRYAAVVGWFPVLLVVWYFTVQPELAHFRRFTLRSGLPPTLEAVPLRVVGAFAYVLFHNPAQTPPLHLMKNLGMLLVAAVGFGNLRASPGAIREAYTRLLLLTPPVTAVVFLVTGQTKFGYGASTIGFALTGYLAAGLASGTLSHRHRGLARAFVLYALAVVVGDVLFGGLAVAVHVGGFLVGAGYAVGSTR
jgi:hypothetical protein